MSRRLPATFSVVLAALLSILAPSVALGAQGRRAHHGGHHYLTGIGDQNAQMFLDRNWQQLHTPIARYIAPYDVAVHLPDLNKARLWIARAQASHQRILVAFYHSERTPTRMPSVATYQRDVQRFIRYFPHVTEYQAWNEANRGNVRHAFSSPSPSLAARYYAALRKVCRRCAITALDILDQNNYRPTLHYVAQFKSALRHLRVPRPHLWGLHNYSDTNRFGSVRTRAIIRTVGGTVWLTETGGIVKFGRAFPNHHGSGLRRAKRALSYMFRLAASNRHISRLYIFQWLGATAHARFDAGLTDAHFHPRPGYIIVCRHMHAAHCRIRPSRH